MKLLARFDFSRLNEQIALKHPDWLYKSVNGNRVNYNGQVHTCLNGMYQQEKSIGGERLPFSYSNHHKITFTLPKLDLFETVVIKY